MRQDTHTHTSQRPRRGSWVFVLPLVALAVVVIVVSQWLAPQEILPSAPPTPGEGEDAPASAPTQGDPPDAASPKSSLARLFDAGQIKSVLVVGDSITAGYLCEGYDTAPSTGTVVYSGSLGTYTETGADVRVWTNDFRAWALGHGATSFVNAGVNGFTMADLARDPDAWLGNGADAIVVMLGTNDASLPSETPDGFERDATAALSATATRCKLLVVVSPPDNVLDGGMSMGEVDRVLDRVSARAGYAHISLLDALSPGTGDFNADGVHPTSLGSQKLWLALSERLGLSS